MAKEVEAKGWEFEKKGYQQRNLDNLVEILSKKEITEALTVIAKTPKEQWVDIKDAVTKLNDFLAVGGVDQMMQSFKDHVKNTIEENIEAALAPIYNQLETMIGQAFSKFITELHLDDFINNVATYIAENSKGALVGAIIGAIGGPIGTIVGAIVGAAIEDLAEWLTDVFTEAGLIGTEYAGVSRGGVGAYEYPRGRGYPGEYVVNPPSSPTESRAARIRRRGRVF